MRSFLSTKGIVAACVLAIVGYSLIILYFACDQFVDWTNTLLATLISVVLAIVVGIFLFDYQTTKTTTREREQLTNSLKVELTRTASVLDPARDPKAEIVYFSPIILEKAIGSGLFNTSITEAMIGLLAQMNLYRGQVDIALNETDAFSRSLAIQQAGIEGTAVHHSCNNVLRQLDTS